jgi:hypothetical protein
VNWTEACIRPLRISILIQHLKGCKTIDDITDPIEFMCILCQVYIPLGLLSNVYTHNDLHPDNILMYEPIPGKYLTYIYIIFSMIALELRFHLNLILHI